MLCFSLCWKKMRGKVLSSKWIYFCRLRSSDWYGVYVSSMKWGITRLVRCSNDYLILSIWSLRKPMSVMSSMFHRALKITLNLAPCLKMRNF